MAIIVDIRKEDDIERLREVAVLQHAEIGLLHERLSAMSREIKKLREEKQGRFIRVRLSLKPA